MSGNACHVIGGEDVEEQKIGERSIIRGPESHKCSVDHLWGGCAKDLNQVTPESYNNYYDVNQRGERVMLLITSFMLYTWGDEEEISTRNVTCTPQLQRQLAAPKEQIIALFITSYLLHLPP